MSVCHIVGVTSFTIWVMACDHADGQKRFCSRRCQASKDAGGAVDSTMMSWTISR
jgi:hypothetical protein